jgi:conjugal transfer pilus assembly protein TraF
MKIIILILVQVLIQIVPTCAYANNFFNERYRGWLWFEEKPKEEKKKVIKRKSKEFNKEEMEEIKRKNEEFKEELELLKHVMIRYPNDLEHVRRYKEKEKIMLENAINLSKSFLMVNFLNPDLADQLENPQNMYGRKVKKEIDEEERERKIKSLAKNVELFVFIQADCKHCELLEKHLKRFANIYGFQVEAVSRDGSSSKYFKTHFNKELIEKLDLTVMPAVVAVTNDSRLRFELARGAVSVADFEDNAVLMSDYLSRSGGVR